MISLASLLDLGNISIEVLLLEEGGSIDPLEHRLVGVSLPVGAGDRQELERPDLSGVGNMRAAAEVDELALTIKAQDAVLVQLVVDVFDLQVLTQVGDELARVGHGQRESLERLGVGDDPGHLGLDRRKVSLG